MDNFLNIAISAAREAGDFIMTQYEHIEITRKEDNTPVTNADIGAHVRLMHALEKTGVPILSEEAAQTESTMLPYPNELWIVDPLDGTNDFIQKSTDFSVMIGLIRNNTPVLSVIYAPALGVLYYAEKGNGAFIVCEGNTARLTVSNTVMPNLHYIRSKNHFTPYMQLVAEKLNVAASTPRGSVGVKAGLLAEQQGDFFFYTVALGVWDVCGPELIATEAGGRVTDIHGNPLTYGEHDHRIPNGVVFSNGACHEEILEAMRLM